MHIRFHADLAATLVRYSSTLIETRGRFGAENLEQYWTYSKVRADRWGRAFQDYHRATNAPTARHWPELRPVAEEILVADILTRVWTAILCLHDRFNHREESEPIARSVWIGQQEARNRVLSLLANDHRVPAHDAVEIDRLRRRTERWSDLLLGNLAQRYHVGEFTVDSERTGQFAADLDDSFGHEQVSWSLLAASLRESFTERIANGGPSEEFNAAIAASIVGCFPPDAFLGTGIVRSLWQTRIANATTDAQGLIESLLRDHSPVRAASHPGSSRPRRWKVW
jgi:hypothetical protein